MMNRFLKPSIQPAGVGQETPNASHRPERLWVEEVFTLTPLSADLLSLSALIDAGELAPVIDRTYRLDQTRQAMVYVGTRHTRGKVVIGVLADRTTQRRVDHE